MMRARVQVSESVEYVYMGFCRSIIRRYLYNPFSRLLAVFIHMFPRGK